MKLTSFVQRLAVGPLTAGVVLLAANFALAQVGPGGDQDWKIGPYIEDINGSIQRLQASDVVQIPLEHHLQGFQPPFAGWAGYKFTVHVLDNTEVDVDRVIYHPFDAQGMQNMPVGITDPFGPRSNNVVSVPLEWKAVHPQAYQSGIDVFPSSNYQVADLELHIKGTSDPSQNSDTDLVVQVWNIWHFRQGYTSQVVPLGPGDQIWVESQYFFVGQLPPGLNGWTVPPNPHPISSIGGQGHWLQVFQPDTFHMYGSGFYATLADTITVGIEHIPEPTAMALVGLGVACAGLGVRARRKRRIC